MKAYVLLNILPGDVPAAMKHLQALACLQEARATLGPFDAVAVLDLETLGQLSHCVAFEIQTIPGVERTCTCLAVEPT